MLTTPTTVKQRQVYLYLYQSILLEALKRTNTCLVGAEKEDGPVNHHVTGDDSE